MRLALLTLLLAACPAPQDTDTGPDGTDSPLPNEVPVANAGPGQDVGLGDTVTLDGTASYDPDGTLRIGIPVTRSVYLETAFAPQAGLDENQFTGELEWQVAPKVVVEAAVGDQYSWADVFWEIRF